METEAGADEAAEVASVVADAEGEAAAAEGEDADAEGAAEEDVEAVPRAAFDAVVPASPLPPPPQAAIKRLIAMAMKVWGNTTGRSDFVMAKRNTEWAN
ncbi:hypothetical protein [Caballeronia sp. BR00000012568055]|uniref:hypothetical protein n=1 Tax=Caballeronia sp. BR00000012568055 TaxID=2918761 RepID=UPI0023F88373|nr:hypothetical protein [Caballeronia sp. BR00000012568055]